MKPQYKIINILAGRTGTRLIIGNYVYGKNI